MAIDHMLESFLSAVYGSFYPSEGLDIGQCADSFFRFFLSILCC